MAVVIPKPGTKFTDINLQRGMRTPLLCLFPLILICMVANSFAASANGAEGDAGCVSRPAPPFLVPSVEPWEPLNKLFRVKRGWIGADGAYSIPVAPDRSIWTFGDTWIGVIENGRRDKPQMVNNTVAVQSSSVAHSAGSSNGQGDTGHNDSGHNDVENCRINFYWPGGMEHPGSMWVPDNAKQTKTYYWPADGAFVGGRLFVFLHKIRTNLKLPEPFQFESVGDDLVVVENPLEAPDRWRQKKLIVSSDSKTFHQAAACLLDGDYLYIYSNYFPARRDLCPHPLIVSRFKKTEMEATKLDLSCIEYLLEDGSWSRVLASAGDQESQKIFKDAKNPKILFMDGAPEMSVTRVRGLPGYFAVYMPPLTRRIAMRWAEKPEGPWSESITLYDCPEKEDSILQYSAKTHQELLPEDAAAGELIVTYCRNTKKMEEHFSKPDIYFPQALKVRLEFQSGQGNQGNSASK